MFRHFFKKEEEESTQAFQSVDPVLEQRRKEKFSAPLLYNDEIEEESKKVTKEVKKEPVKKVQSSDSTYRMSEIISPISGVKKTYEPEAKPKVQKKVKFKSNSDELIPIISPFYGPAIENDDIEVGKAEQAVEEPSVEKNLRNIANIVKEEQDQLKIIEERTGEFKLDFKKEQDSLIDEIDDSMSLDELMSLYEKKFKD